MANPSTHPKPAALIHLRATNSLGLAFTVATVVATAAGAWLSTRPGLVSWLSGQLLLAAALVEWFVLLHECGHGTLFRTRWLNVAVGQLAGVLALIPFPVWRRVHAKHHKWTGWQDLDPTTAALTPRPRAAWQLAVVNVCWKCWIPLFSVIYRITNFWDLPRLRRLFPESQVRRSLAASAIAVASLYSVAFLAVGPAMVARVIGLALLVALVVEDVLILSQHTHVPMGHSEGRAVAPFASQDQERFTRSLRLPEWMSRAALHVDAHELHHMYPFVPGYRLREIDYATKNEVGCTAWIRAARALPGAVLLFQNRDSSGFTL